MKKLLETYLFLLTEDPHLDYLESEINKARKLIGKMGAKANEISSKYIGIHHKDIPSVHDRKIVEDYYDTVAKYKNLQREKDLYKDSILSGRKSTYSPGGYQSKTNNFWKDFEETQNQYWKDFNQQRKSYRQKNYNNIHMDYDLQQRMRKAQINYEKTMKRIRMGKIVTTTIFLIIISYIMYASYKDDKNIKQNVCSKYKGKRKELCLSISKLSSLQKQKVLLNSFLTKCNKTSKPQVCKEEVIKKINKINEKIKNTKNNINKLTKEIKI